MKDPAMPSATVCLYYYDVSSYFVSLDGVVQGRGFVFENTDSEWSGQLEENKHRYRCYDVRPMQQLSDAVVDTVNGKCVLTRQEPRALS
ncbi:hypothetical protein Q31b_00200 [Novipirellula aureliae]|uniref:Uncharacterized protein n=1 Tax=Novipirellula aureliae TaxID=2527966 RepID=A0A5C6E7P4_9BACT|nr:hypothetical protein Q31b_00200 [Novipirellula aureliae]